MEKLKATDFIMYNGVDLQLYRTSFTDEQLTAVLQWLQLFKWDKRAEKALRYIIWQHKLGTKVQSKVSVPRGKIVEPDPLQNTVGECPKCGGVVRGKSLPRCETSATGRVYYTECDDCVYYTEYFLDDKIIKGE
jgi:hypothetical protein